jgi:LuxR family transcriptional regulator, maltose regulon positive regulatory protein
MHRTALATNARVGCAPHQDPKTAHLAPVSLLLRAWRSIIELRLEDAWATVGQFEHEAAQLHTPIAPRFRELAEVLTAVLQVFKSQHGPTLRSALIVIEKRFRSTAMTPALATTLRVGYWKVRDLDRYYTVPRFKHPVGVNRCPHWVASILGPMFEAAVEAEQLRMTVAMRLARSAHERALNRFGKRAPVTARAAVIFAEMLYEEGHRNEVDSLMKESLPVLRTTGDEDNVRRGYGVMARVAARRGDSKFAFLVITEAIGLAMARDWAAMLADAFMQRAQLLIKGGRVRDAEICADRIEAIARDQVCSGHEIVHVSLALARAQVMVATGNARGGVNILRELECVSCGKSNHYWGLQLSVLLSDALLACGDQAEGRALLIQALQVGMRAGVYQTFVDAGEHVTNLLLSLHHAQTDSRLPAELTSYVDSILADHARQSVGAMPIRASRATETLSPREHSVLRSMSCGLSNKRIAQELQITPENVKSHVKGIFVKLAVQSRAHAVSTAGALGLL